MNTDGRCPQCGEPYDDHKLPATVSGYMGLQLKPQCRPIKDRHA